MGVSRLVENVAWDFVCVKEGSPVIRGREGGRRGERGKGTEGEGRGEEGKRKKARWSSTERKERERDRGEERERREISPLVFVL